MCLAGSGSTVDMVRRPASRPDPVLAILEELFMARSRSAAAHDLEPDEGQTQAGDALVSRLPSLRATLKEQHRFRSEQLARLEACTRQEVPSDSGAREAVLALREVDELLAAGARRALTDIELALVRMDTGRYGDCRSCGNAIPRTLLEAIPKTTLCLACRHRDERAGHQALHRKSTTVRRRRQSNDPVGPARQR